MYWKVQEKENKINKLFPFTERFYFWLFEPWRGDKVEEEKETQTETELNT